MVRTLKVEWSKNSTQNLYKNQQNSKSTNQNEKFPKKKSSLKNG
jgi:hypothetical protein